MNDAMPDALPAGAVARAGPVPAAAESRRAMILHAPILPTILKLAAPNLVVMLSQALANFLESYYVGLLGVDALAGAALVFPLVMLMMMMSGGGIGGGISSAVARALGSGRQDKADAIALHAVVIAAAFGLTCSAIVLLAGTWIFHAMGGEGAALAAALTYSGAIFSGVVFLWLMNCCAAVLRGAGNMVVPACVLAGGVVLLLGLSPALIFGFGPLPALGVAGAGLALATYYLIAATILVSVLARGTAGVRLSLKHRLRMDLFREILGVGIWSSLNTILANLCVLIATYFVARTSMEALAGFGLGIRIEYLQIPIVFGFGTGIVAMVGMNIGAGQTERARRIAWTGAGVAAVVTESVGLAAAIFPEAWLGLFTHDATAIATGALYLRTVAPAYAFLGIGLALYFASQGAGSMGWALAAAVARFMTLGLGCTLMARLFPGNLGALCSALAVALAVFAAVNSLPWLRSGRLERQQES